MRSRAADRPKLSIKIGQLFVLVGIIKRDIEAEEQALAAHCRQSDTGNWNGPGPSGWLEIDMEFPVTGLLNLVSGKSLSLY